MDYRSLNHQIKPVGAAMNDAWQRVLGRLGDYTALVVGAANLRPSAVTFYAQTEQFVLVRILVAGEYLILRIAPEEDMAAYVFFVRVMSGQKLPSVRIIQRDLSRTRVPFAYTIESFVPGLPATTLSDEALLRGAGRQAGQTLRRMHRIAVPGVGRPNALGRWPDQSWNSVLHQISALLAPPPVDAMLFGEFERSVLALIPTDERLNLEQPCLIHGNFGPEVVRCTTGSHVHLEMIAEPSPWIGGDGLFDLARGLCAIYPDAWREGLLEGYQSITPLNEAERTRLALLRLLTNAWIACYRYSRALPHEAALNEALDLFDGLIMA
jgi:hypothetical protein